MTFIDCSMVLGRLLRHYIASHWNTRLWSHLVLCLSSHLFVVGASTLRVLLGLVRSLSLERDEEPAHLLFMYICFTTDLFLLFESFLQTKVL